MYYGVPGSNALSTVLTGNSNNSNLTFTHSVAPGAAYYYYLEITQADGNKIWTSPIWVTRSFSTLAIEAITLRGIQKSEIIQLSASFIKQEFYKS